MSNYSQANFFNPNEQMTQNMSRQPNTMPPQFPQVYMVQGYPYANHMYPHQMAYPTYTEQNHQQDRNITAQISLHQPQYISNVQAPQVQPTQPAPHVSQPAATVKTPQAYTQTTASKPSELKRKRTPLILVDNKEKPAAEVSTPVKESKAVSPVPEPVEEEPPAAVSGQKSLLFEVDTDKENAPVASEQVEKPKTPLELYNEDWAKRCEEYTVAHKPQKKYTHDELRRIGSHPCTEIKISETSHQEVFKTICSGKYKGNYKPKPPGIQFNLDVKLETVDKKFTPEHLKAKNAGGNTSDKLLKDLNVILNRLMENNIDESIAEIKALNVENADNQHILAKAIFEKAINQSRFARAFARLTAHFWNSSIFKKDIVTILQGRVSKTLEKHLQEANADLDEKIAKETDSVVKKIFEERRETVVSKAEECYYGTMTYMAELYVENKFSDEKMISILGGFVDKLTPDNAKSLQTILDVAGQCLDSKEKLRMDEIYKKLKTNIAAASISSFQVYHFEMLFKRRADGWVEANPHAPSTTTSSDSKKGSSTSATGGHNLMNINHSNLTQQGETLKPSTKGWGQGCASGSQPRKNTPFGSNAAQAVAAKPAVQTQDQYDNEFQKIHGDPVEMFTVNDTSYLEHLEKFYKPAYVHFIIEKMLSDKIERRHKAGDLLASLMLNQPVSLNKEDFVEAGKWFSGLVEDNLEDCPNLFTNMTHMLHRLILSDVPECSFLADFCREFGGQSYRKKTAEMLLDSVSLAVKSGLLPAAKIASKFSGNALRSYLMQDLQLSEQQLAERCKEVECQFLVDRPRGNKPNTASDMPRHSMPASTKPIPSHQNGNSRATAMPEPSKWGPQGHVQIAQRSFNAPPRQSQPMTQSAPRSNPPPPSGNPQRDSTENGEGWLSNTNKKKNKPRQTESKPRAAQMPSGAPTKSEIHNLLEPGSNSTPEQVRDLLAKEQNLPALLGVFAGKLFRRISTNKREDMETWIRLLKHFQVTKADTRSTILTELDNKEKMSPDVRKSLLDCLLSQDVVCREDLVKWAKNAAPQSQLGTLIKTKYPTVPSSAQKT